jgi:NTP pyrophosphatase (non-canonical NTP hydrolase)
MTTTNTDVRGHVAELISLELERAYAKHGTLPWGRHEFFALMREEVDELWDAIRHDHTSTDVIDEAIQVAAMVFRYLETGDRYLGDLTHAIEVVRADKVARQLTMFDDAAR